MEIDGFLWTYDLFSAEEIALSADALSEVCDVRGKAPNDRFVLHYTVTGTGVLRIIYLTAYHYGGTYVTPSAALEVGSGILVGSDFIEFSPILAPFIKFQALETGGAASATITAHLLTK